jgi:hypothetical protein
MTSSPSQFDPKRGVARGADRQKDAIKAATQRAEADRFIHPALKACLGPSRRDAAHTTRGKIVSARTEKNAQERIVGAAVGT